MTSMSDIAGVLGFGDTATLRAARRLTQVLTRWHAVCFTGGAARRAR